MKLELKDMKITKVDLIENSGNSDAVDAGLENVVNVLNPTTFALIIKRNLSAGWYKEIPELEISGRLKSIVVNLMTTDYHLLMSILARNMTEGADECTAVAAAPVPRRLEVGMCNTEWLLQYFGFFSFFVWIIFLAFVAFFFCFVMIFNLLIFLSFFYDLSLYIKISNQNNPQLDRWIVNRILR